MPQLYATTVFRFVCTHCEQTNEYRAAHRSTVQPHLVTTKCVHCGRSNWLGGVAGTREPASSRDADVEIPAPAVASA